MRPAVFFDRDGTLIREVHYLSRLADLELLPGTGSALAKLGEHGYLRFLVTNQSGLARGYFDAAFLEQVHAELRRRVQAVGGALEGVYVCPHHPDFDGPCACRKPAPGLVLQALREHPVDLAGSWVVGDKAADLGLARNAGCRAALVRTGYGERTARELAAVPGPRPDLIVDDVRQAVEEILK